MQKFFVNNNQIESGKININGEDVNHIVNVLRLNTNDEIQICNIDTSENYIAQITNCTKNQVMCNILKKIDETTESNIKIDIYQGLPKADKMELIIQKTTEIGVRAIIPVEMERSIVKLDAKDKQKRVERWQKIAEVAAKQSKRDIIPKVENCINVKEILNRINNYDKFIVAYEEEKNTTLKHVLKTIEEQRMTNKSQIKGENITIGVLIGPEGGIDSKEIELLKEKVDIVTLGKRILRTETAPIVISSIIIYELEN